MKRLFQNDFLVGLILVLTVFFLFMTTLACGVGPYDAGELATVAATLGIAHPSGYPLWTLLGWIFAHLPLGHRVIWNLNLLSAVLCSLAAFFFYRLFLLLLSVNTLHGFGFSPMPGASGKRQGIKTQSDLESQSTHRVIAVIVVLLFAFSRTYWEQAVYIEVYALHLLFLSLVVLLFLRALLESRFNPGPAANWRWYLFSYVLGLSFTNHMTTILLAPAFLYLFFATHGFRNQAWVKIGQAVFPFLAGLSLYLYLPIRAARNPLMNWGNPATLEEFLWHVTTKQYHHWMFSSWTIPAKQLGQFLSDFPFEFGYISLLFMLPGLWYLFRHNKRMLIFSLLLFFGCLLFSLNYSVSDTHSFSLTAYMAANFWILFGIRSFINFSGKAARQWAKILRFLPWVACAVLPIFSFFIHYRGCDKSGDYAAEDFTKNMLVFLEPNAILLSNIFYFSFPAYYLQFVENTRPDVVALNYNFLTFPWYYKQLEQKYPWLTRDLRAEIDANDLEYFKFERGEKTSPAALNLRTDAVIRGIIAKYYGTRPIYITSDIKPEYFPGYTLIPSGLAFRLFRDTLPAPSPPREFSFRPFHGDDSYVEDIQRYYSAGYVNQGIYRIVLHDSATALVLFRKAFALKPDFPPAREWLAHLGGRVNARME